MSSLLFGLFVVLMMAAANAQQFFHRQLAYPTEQQFQYAAAPSQLIQAMPSYAHPSVIENADREATLPAELRKSDRFYNNPRIAAALAKESWFTDKEMPVVDREAEKIPRDMVFKIFRNAGWIQRR